MLGFAVTLQTTEVTATVHSKHLRKTEKALHLGWKTGRESVFQLITTCCPGKYRACISKRSPAMNDTEPVTASKGWFFRYRKRPGLKNTKATGEAACAHEEAAATLPAELQKWIS